MSITLAFNRLQTPESPPSSGIQTPQKQNSSFDNLETSRLTPYERLRRIPSNAEQQKKMQDTIGKAIQLYDDFLKYRSEITPTSDDEIIQTSEMDYNVPIRRAKSDGSGKTPEEKQKALESQSQKIPALKPFAAFIRTIRQNQNRTIEPKILDGYIDKTSENKSWDLLNDITILIFREAVSNNNWRTLDSLKRTCKHFKNILNEKPFYKEEKWLRLNRIDLETPAIILRQYNSHQYNGVLAADLDEAAIRSLSKIPFRKLYLNDFQINDIWLATLGAAARNLNAIKISHGNITEVGLLALKQGCPNLTHLSLDDCGYLTDHGFIALVHNSALKVLELKYASQISEASLSEWAKKSNRDLNRNLEILRIIGNRFENAIPLKPIADCSAKLQELDLRYSSVSGNDTSLQALSPNLRILRMNSSMDVTDQGIKDLVTKCPNIKILDLKLKEVNDAVLIAIASNLKQLSALSLSFDTIKVTQKGILELNKCTNLKKLKFKLESPDTETPSSFRGEGAEAVGNISLNLQEFTLTSHAINWKSLENMLKGCTKLEKLNLKTNSYNSTASHLADLLNIIAMHCPELKSLKFGHYKHTPSDNSSLQDIKTIDLVNKALFNLSEKCPKLKQLTITGMSVFDHDINKLFEQANKTVKVFPNLGWLDVSHSPITSQTILEIAKSMGPRLKYLNISHCQNLILQDSELSAALTSLNMHCPNLERLEFIGHQVKPNNKISNLLVNNKQIEILLSIDLRSAEEAYNSFAHVEQVLTKNGPTIRLRPKNT